MNNKLSSVSFLFTLTAVVLGGVAGYFVPGFMLSISFIGTLFLNSLKIIAIPFVITMIIAGIASMGSKEKVKRSLGKIALYFIPTSLMASLLGVLLALGIQPGVGTLKNGAYIPEEIIPHLSSFSFNNLLGNLIPENFLSASTEMQFFAVIFIAMIFGTVLTTIDRKNRMVLDFFLSAKEMLSGFMKMILFIAPLGLFSLVGTLFAENWQNAEMLFSSVALFTITIIFGLSFFALVLLPIIARIYSNISPYKYFVSMVPALSTAFATNSAVASLPITEECINTTTVDQRASAFALPLGALFNSAGTALFLSASAIFIAQLYGLTISIGQILTVVGGSFIIATFTAFIPYASLLMIALVLQIANFPIHVTAGVGILILVDFLFGRLRTVVDVWADAIGAAVLGNTFDFKTARSAKAAIPIKSTYNKAKSRTPRDSSIDKDDYQKTKRGSKSKPLSKPYNDRKKTKELSSNTTNEIETKSPFQISPEKNYLSESENKIVTTNVKPDDKQRKSPIVKHNIKVPKITKEFEKNESPIIDSKPKQVLAKKDRPKPIIHKIEVPPLPVIPSFKEKQVEAELKTKQIDEDSVIKKVNAVLSQDTIERERAKIAAQLNLMREKESSLILPQEEEQISSIDAEIEEFDKQNEDQFTKIDFYSDDTLEDEDKPMFDKSFVNTDESIKAPINTVEPKAESTSVLATEEETSLETAEPIADNLPDKKSPISYGRKSSKRVKVKKTEELQSQSDTEPTQDSIPEATTVPEPEPQKTTSEEKEKEFANKPMSFGRSKKKK